MESLARWLESLGVDGLARILANRPEVTGAPVPRGLRELAERLQWPGGANAAVQSLPLPATQLVEAILATRTPTRAAVARTVGVAVAALDGPLAELTDRALVWPDDDELRVCAALSEAIEWPLHLGRPLAELIHRWRADELKLLAHALGLPVDGRRTDLLAALAGWYAQSEGVQALVASAPPAARQMLEELAWHGPEVAVPGFTFAGSAERIPGPVGWAVRHGMLVVTSWQEAHLPREVAVALRGPQWRPTLDLTPPEVALAAVDPVAVAREAAVAAGAALDQLAAVLAECGRTPPALLKSGGVGVREVKRLARTTGVPAAEVPFWLELGYAAGLLAATDEGIAPTDGYDEWCTTEPGRRMATVLRAWWSLGAQPNWPGRTPAPAVLSRDGAAALLVRARRAVLELATGYPADRAVADPAALGAVLTWHLPVVVLGLEPLDEQVAAVWREARLLGLVAYDAATELARALVADDDEELPAVAQRLLPPPATHAIFQTDLTALVPGTPATPLAELLDAAGDREARGTASTWRFTADSVRRALDAGHDGPGLTTALCAAAMGGALPQALTYLIADTARRHGLLRVRAVRCVLHAADPALLAEVAATRALAPLRLSVLAPTVLGSAADVAPTLAALRAAGYAPIGEDETGTPQLDRLPRLRAPQPAAQSRHCAPEDPRTLAETLLAKTAAARAERVEREPEEPTAKVIPLRRTLPAPPTADQLIDRYAAQLTPAQRRLLAHAIAEDDQVRIGYLDSAGQHTRRVIEQLELDDDALVAWCHLRNDERRFLLERIDSVTPA